MDYKFRIRYLLFAAYTINTRRITGVLHITAKDNRCILRIEFHCIANAVHSFASHKRGTTTAEGIHYDCVFLRRVPKRITQQVKRLTGGMVLVALRLFEVPDSCLLAVRIPGVLAVFQEPVKHRLVLPLIIAPSQNQTVLYPDAASGKVEPGIDKCLTEVQTFGIGVEYIRRTTGFQMCRHIDEGAFQELIELLILHALLRTLCLPCAIRRCTRVPVKGGCILYA